MKHTFSQVPRAEIPRSTFNRTHGYKTTFDAGYLIPFLVDEALPGDTFKCNVSALARLATPIVPIMDNMYLDTQFFSVPLRLLWDNWQKFNGEQKNPGDSTDFTIPQIVSPAAGYKTGGVFDYMGLPVGVSGISHSALFLRAYNLIWNEWYRDQNLQVSLPVPTGDGPDLPDIYPLQRRGKRHDYFTSALPWPQKGPGVQIPLGTSAPVIGGFFTRNDVQTDNALLSVNVGAPAVNVSLSPGKTSGLYADPTAVDGLRADLSEATAATINSLRQAFRFKRSSSVTLVAVLATPN